MTILGTTEHIKYIPNDFNTALKEEIAAKLRVLDDNYGPARLFSREGGFVAIIDNPKDYETLKNTNFLDVSKDVPEFIDTFGNYNVSTYIVGADFGIVLVENTTDTFKKEYLKSA